MTCLFGSSPGDEASDPSLKQTLLPRWEVQGTHTLIRKNQIFTLFRDEAPERLFMIRRVRSSMLDGSHRQDCPECGPGFAPHPTWCEGRDSVYVPRVPLVERELVEWETVGTTSE